MRSLAVTLLCWSISSGPALAALPTDLDSDGFPNAVDDCRFVADLAQTDTGGVGESSAPDGVGDACQCGDLTGSGRVDELGVTALRAALAGLGAPLTPGALERCAVFGDLAPCDVLQLTVLRRRLANPSLGPLTDTASAQHCPAALSEQIHVATTGALVGDGTPANPMRRITDAVTRARADRIGGELPAGGGIEIRVAAGEYVGSFTSNSPPAEVLPIILNVPDLSMRGATVLTRDSLGLPDGTQAATETILRSAVALTGGQYLFVVGRTTDGGIGDRASVQGFVLEGVSPVFHSVGVFVDRVTGFAIRGNLIQRTGYGLMTRLSSGVIEGNLSRLNNNSGAFVTGGSSVYPAVVSVRGNRFQQSNGHGLMVKGIGGVSAPIFNAVNAVTLQPLQTFYDRTLPADLLNLPERLDVSVVGNEMVSNPLLGLRIAANTTEGLTGNCVSPVEYGTPPSQLLSSVIHVDAMQNRMIANQVYGTAIEVSFPCRNDPRPYRYDATARFVANSYASNGLANSMFTFTRYLVSAGMESSTAYKYVQDSTYDVEDPSGELVGFRYDNPATDPVTLAPLNNTLRMNGVVVPPGKLAP